MARRPATEANTLRLTTVVRAARDRVFQAWTTPEDIVRWWGRPWGMSVPSAEVDLRQGGRYRIVMRPPLRPEYAVVGTYQVVEPPGRLEYTLAWERGDWRSKEMTVTVEFLDRGDGTEILLTHTGFSNGASRVFHSVGWGSGFKRLNKLMRRRQNDQEG